jgi:hypothetical protein
MRAMASPYEPLRVIQQFISVCAECPHCTYYSGGMYECILTKEPLPPDTKKYSIGEHCPLPFAGPPRPAGRAALAKEAQP